MTNQDSNTKYTPLAGVVSPTFCAQTTLASDCAANDTVTLVFPRYLDDNLFPLSAYAYPTDGYNVYSLMVSSIDRPDAKIVLTNISGSTIPSASNIIISMIEILGLGGG